MGTRSNEYPQSMFWSKNKKNRYTPCIPQFCYIKVGYRGYTLHRHVFLMFVDRGLDFGSIGGGLIPTGAGFLSKAYFKNS